MIQNIKLKLILLIKSLLLAQQFNKMILKFRTKATRQQALQWLSQHYNAFPKITGVSKEIFNRWHFIMGTDDIVYFANCVEHGITEQELLDFKSRSSIIKQDAALRS